MDLRILFFNIIVFLFLFYIIFGLYLFFFQKSMIYFPDNQDFEKCLGFIDYEKKDSHGTRFYYKENSTDKVIVYYHGNAGSACDRSVIKHIFEESGASIIFVEYAGFSNDHRKPSKKLLLKDAENIVRFIEEKGFSSVTLYGQSLGSGVASYHSSISDVDKIIFVSPYSSVADIAQRMYRIYPAKLILTENFDNIKWLEEFRGKLHIIHGDNDYIINPIFSKKLFEQAKTNEKSYHLIKGYGHNDIWNSVDYKILLAELLNN